MNNRCLFCYKPLKEGEVDFHSSCAKKFFGTKDIPTLNYTHSDMDALALQIIEAQTTLTGVQPKLSLHLSKTEGVNRLTIVGLWGGYIFKPQTANYIQLPEIEDLTMHLAEIAKINVVPHSLIRLKDGEIGYITRRIDRTECGKIPMEDMCQLSERQTEYKYKSSYEKVAKTIKEYSAEAKLDITNLFEIVLFSFITGNNDMHLKNFSLYQPTEGNPVLSPAYDLLNAAIINTKDNEELALTLNGKKRKLCKDDFMEFAFNIGIDKIVAERLIGKMKQYKEKWNECINNSFINNDLKQKYMDLIQERINRL